MLCTKQRIERPWSHGSSEIFSGRAEHMASPPAHSTSCVSATTAAKEHAKAGASPCTCASAPAHLARKQSAAQGPHFSAKRHGEFLRGEFAAISEREWGVCRPVPRTDWTPMPIPAWLASRRPNGRSLRTARPHNLCPNSTSTWTNLWEQLKGAAVISNGYGTLCSKR
jgi:hypothetical protein